VLRTKVLKGDTYWLFVDSAGGSAGAYKLDVSLQPGAFCGNGKVDPGEACDDRNKTPADGCEPDCSPGGNPTSGNACPGMPITVWGPTVTARAQTTERFGLVFERKAGTCGGTSTATGTNAPDRVYAVTAKKTGTMKVTTAGASFDLQLYVRGTCTDAATQIACASAAIGNAPETTSFPVTEGSTYHVIVDGLVSASGGYDIAFAIE
jgi:cysteine-rich repeat protein